MREKDRNILRERREKEERKEREDRFTKKKHKRERQKDRHTDSRFLTDLSVSHGCWARECRRNNVKRRNVLVDEMVDHAHGSGGVVSKLFPTLAANEEIIRRVAVIADLDDFNILLNEYPQRVTANCVVNCRNFHKLLKVEVLDEGFHHRHR